MIGGESRRAYDRGCSEALSDNLIGLMSEKNWTGNDVIEYLSSDPEADEIIELIDGHFKNDPVR